MEDELEALREENDELYSQVNSMEETIDRLEDNLSDAKDVIELLQAKLDAIGGIL